MEWVVYVSLCLAASDARELYYGRDYGVAVPPRTEALQLPMDDVRQLICSLVNPGESVHEQTVRAACVNACAALPADVMEQLLLSFCEHFTVAGDSMLYAIVCVGTARDLDAGTQVARRIATSHDLEVVRKLARLVASRWNDDHVKVWCDALTDSRDPVRAMAAGLLRYWHSRTQYEENCTLALEALLRAADDPNLGVRKMAIDSLAAFRDLEMIGNAVVTKAVTKLSMALSEPVLRASAARAIAEMGPSAISALPSLVAELSDEREVTRICLVQAIGRIECQSEEGAQAVVECLCDASTWVRWQAMEALQVIGSPAGPALLRKAHTNDKTARRIVIYLLARLDDPPNGSEDCFLAAIEDEDPYIRLEAARALGMLGMKKTATWRSIHALCGTVSDKDPLVRTEAASALEWFGPAARESIPLLIERLEDKNVNVRIAAASAIASIAPGCPRTLAPLTPLLHDANDTVRVKAAVAIQKMPAEIGVPTLCEVLKDREARVRSVAAWLLGMYGEMAGIAIPALEQASGDGDRSVRWNAARAIEAIGGEKDR